MLDLRDTVLLSQFSRERARQFPLPGEAAPASEPEPTEAGAISRKEAFGIAFAMEDHSTAISEFADTLLMISTCDDLDDPWRSIVHRAAREIGNHIDTMEQQRKRITKGLNLHTQELEAQ